MLVNVCSLSFLLYVIITVLSVKIISSSTPCGDFFFRSYWNSESQRVDVASSRTSSCSRCQSCVSREETRSDVTSIVKQCNDLDLNIIVIWKVIRSNLIKINTKA